VRVQAHILNGLYHVQACFHAAHRVIRSRLPVVALELRHTVVTIAQQLNAQTMMLRSQSIKAAMEVEKWKRRSWKMDRKI